jgi:predicted ABC-type ATPase
MPAIQLKPRDDSPPDSAVPPILLLLVGASGSGKTTFYENHLKTVVPKVLKGSASPLEQAETDRERNQLLKRGESLVYQDVVFDRQLIREARSVGYDVKAIYIATEDPTLNLGRILIRVNNGGRFGPIGRIPADCALGLKQLPKIRKMADDLFLFDNTAHAHGARLVAHFRQGKLVKLTRTIPKWVQRAFGKEFNNLLKPPARWGSSLTAQ